MTIRRVLLAGTTFYGYLHSIAQAMGRAGIAADVVPYPYVRRGWRSWPARLGVPHLQRAYRVRLLNELLSKGPGADAVLLLRGDLLEPADIEELRTTLEIPVVLWLIDTLAFMQGGRALSLAADIVLCYCREDARKLASEGCTAVFFPLAFDPRQYFVIPGVQKDIDLYFVGNFHPERQAFLEELLVGLGDRKLSLVFDGPLYDPLRPWLWTRTRRAYPHLFRAVTNRRLDHSQINTLTNRARVCLNVLPAQAVSALNIRAYEICGAGGFQVVTENHVLGGLFEVGREVVSFQSVSDLVTVVDRYLTQSAMLERDSIAAAGHRRATAEHSFDSRVATLVQALG